MAETSHTKLKQPFKNVDYTWHGNKLVASNKAGFRAFAYKGKESNMENIYTALNQEYCEWAEKNHLIVNIAKKKCTSCFVSKKYDEFYLKDTGAYNPVCKKCISIRGKRERG